MNIFFSPERGGSHETKKQPLNLIENFEQILSKAKQENQGKENLINEKVLIQIEKNKKNVEKNEQDFKELFEDFSTRILKFLENPKNQLNDDKADFFQYGGSGTEFGMLNKNGNFENVYTHGKIVVVKQNMIKIFLSTIRSLNEDNKLDQLHIDSLNMEFGDNTISRSPFAAEFSLNRRQTENLKKILKEELNEYSTKLQKSLDLLK
ncbi:MAG: hypothetical protein WC414_02925 [Patescibacteria group bacterium]